MIQGQLVNKDFISGDCIVTRAIFVKSSSKRKEASLELSAISFTYSTNTSRWPPSLQLYQPFWMHERHHFISKISNSCTLKGREIPVPGLRLISNRLSWPIWWTFDPSSDSLRGSTQLVNIHHLGQIHYLGHNIFSVLVSQINVLESYSDISLF